MSLVSSNPSPGAPGSANIGTEKSEYAPSVENARGNWRPVGAVAALAALSAVGVSFFGRSVDPSEGALSDSTTPIVAPHITLPDQQSEVAHTDTKSAFIGRSSTPGCVWVQKPFEVPTEVLRDALVVRFIFDETPVSDTPVIERDGVEVKVHTVRPSFYDTTRENYVKAIGYTSDGKEIDLTQRARMGGQVMFMLPKLDGQSYVGLGVEYLRIEDERPLREAAHQQALSKGLYTLPVGREGELYPWKLQSGEWAPDISGASEGASFSAKYGEVLSFSDSQFKDKVVIIDVWATWCGLCVTSVRPEIRELFEKHSQDIAVVSVNFADTPAKAFREEGKDPAAWYKVIISTESDLRKYWERTQMGSMSYGISDVVVVGADGELLLELRGAKQGAITEKVEAYLTQRRLAAGAADASK